MSLLPLTFSNVPWKHSISFVVIISFPKSISVNYSKFWYFFFFFWFCAFMVQGIFMKLDLKDNQDRHYSKWAVAAFLRGTSNWILCTTFGLFLHDSLVIYSTVFFCLSTRCWRLQYSLFMSLMFMAYCMVLELNHWLYLDPSNFLTIKSASYQCHVYFKFALEN